MSKFKVGDKVRCVDGNGRGGGWQRGYEFKVTKIDEYPDSRNIYWRAINGAGVYEDSLEKVNPNLWKGKAQ